MIVRHKAPVPGVLGPMEVVADHPIVIHFEGIAGFFAIVDIDLAVAHDQFVALVGADDALIDRIVEWRQFYRRSHPGDSDRAVIVSRPVMHFIIGENSFDRRVYIQANLPGKTIL
jgi:hypothetical protein